MKTTLVNLRTCRLPPSDYVLIDRRTVFGNHQYRIGVYNYYFKRRLTREDCVNFFRRQFERKMETDPGYRAAVEGLRGKRLACWCTPLACHGDVYVEYFENGPWW